jgi:D-glycero-D-manno-heptose 1,7-bisphosphate phosphatase
LKKAVFLDRDGTLIEDWGYAHRIEDLQFLPGVIEGLKRLQERFLFFIITNQSGIARGLYTIDDFHTFHNYFLHHLRCHGIEIERTYFCPHIGGCDCKKPSTKFIDEAIRLHGIESRDSWVIGDHPSDITMGRNARCNTVYLLTGHGRKHLSELEEKEVRPTIIVNDFSSAVEFIMSASF